MTADFTDADLGITGKKRHLYTQADLETHIGAVLAEAADRATARWAARREHADRLAEMDYPEALIDAKTVSAKADEAKMIAAEIRALRPTALTALDRAKREARVEGMREALAAAEEQQTERCAKCGAPRNDHHYRHPFVSSGFSDPLAAIAALIEAERGKP